MKTKDFTIIIFGVIAVLIFPGACFTPSSLFLLLHFGANMNLKSIALIRRCSVLTFLKLHTVYNFTGFVNHSIKQQTVAGICASTANANMPDMAN